MATLARHKIIARLHWSDRPLALHELNIEGVSQAAASARLRELAREGVAISVKVPGKRYTAWALKPTLDTLFLRI